MFNPVIFREYDIRGVVEKDYDTQFAYDLGLAFCHYVQEKNPGKKLLLTTGMDARLTSPTLQQALAQGMSDGGAKVLNIGLVTTPVCYFSVFHLEADGGIMVTGSHNPPEYNGFKISLAKGTIFGAEIQKLREIIEKQIAKKVSGGTTEAIDIITPYVRRYAEEFKGLKNIPVVLDCGNGAAGSVLRKLYEACGLTPHILFEQPDGHFPNHHPDPTVEENIVELKKVLKEKKAALGIGFDGDADRIVIVDENGNTILGDEFMVLVSRDILKTNPGAKIIGDVKCSDRMYNDIEKNGGVPIMWKTGHSLIKNKIKEEMAPFGGELSGHIFFADRNYGYDDSLYAGLRVIEILSKTGKTVSQLLADLPAAFNTPEIRIDTTEEKKVAIVETLIRHFTEKRKDLKLNLIDGLRVSYPNGWALARASNTQPVLVLRFEADSEAEMQAIQNEFESIVNPLL